jgi:hypothetical protein
MTADTKTTSLDLKDFFSATDARLDRWQRLNSAAKALTLPRPAGPVEIHSHHAAAGLKLLKPDVLKRRKTR